MNGRKKVDLGDIEKEKERIKRLERCRGIMITT